MSFYCSFKVDSDKTDILCCFNGDSTWPSLPKKHYNGLNQTIYTTRRDPRITPLRILSSPGGAINNVGGKKKNLAR